MEHNFDNQFRLPTQESQHEHMGIDYVEVEEPRVEKEPQNIDSRVFKSDIFTKHYTKRKLQDGNIYTFCNYCSTKYKF